MATTQVLKATRSVDDRMRGVDDQVAGVDGRGKAIDGKVTKIIDGTRTIFSQLPISLILTHPDGDKAKVVMQQTADDVDRAKRSSIPNLICANAEPHPYLQGVNCVRTNASGFPHRTHPPTITLPVVPISKERQRGSFKVVPSKTGSAQVRFFGSTVNVSSSTAIYIISPDGPLSASWLWEECTLVRRFLTIFVQGY